MQYFQCLDNSSYNIWQVPGMTKAAPEKSEKAGGLLFSWREGAIHMTENAF